MNKSPAKTEIITKQFDCLSADKNGGKIQIAKSYWIMAIKKSILTSNFT